MGLHKYLGSWEGPEYPHVFQTPIVAFMKHHLRWKKRLSLSVIAVDLQREDSKHHSRRVIGKS